MLATTAVDCRQHFPALVLALLACGIPPLTLARAASADEVLTCAQAAERAQELRDQARLVDAREKLRVCVRDACPAVVHDDCRRWLTQVEADLPSIVVFANDTQGQALRDVRVLVDGREVAARLDGMPIPVDPGMRRFGFARAGQALVEQTLLVRTGEKSRRVEVKLAGEAKPATPVAGPVDAPSGASYGPWPWVLGAAGLAALGVGGYVGLDARSDTDDLRNRCAPRCTDAQVDDVERRLLIADVTMGVGVVGVGVAVWMLLSGGEDAPAVDLQTGASGVGAVWRGQF